MSLSSLSLQHTTLSIPLFTPRASNYINVLSRRVVTTHRFSLNYRNIPKLVSFPRRAIVIVAQCVKLEASVVACCTIVTNEVSRSVVKEVYVLAAATVLLSCLEVCESV